MRLEDVIKLEEGFSGGPYVCSGGATTIGYGRNLEANPLSRVEAGYLLANDLVAVDVDLSALLGSLYDEIGESRRNALASMRYQLGPAGIRRFVKMLAAVKASDWDSAAREALDSQWAIQTPARAQRCADALRTGRDVWREMA